MSKIFSWKVTPNKYDFRLQCRYSINALYTTRWCSVSKQMKPKILSSKVTPISIFAGSKLLPVSIFKNCSLHHQVVSGVKINDAKNFLLKSYPVSIISALYDIPVSIFKKVLFTPPGGVGCQNKWCQKFFLEKLLQISMILGPYDIPVSIFKKVLFTPPGGVRCQNTNGQKFFFR